MPIRKDDFKKVRNLKLYCVDKTCLVDEILKKNNVEVFLFTRPRRFRKTLNMSMLDTYLNRRYEGNTWFDGLVILDLRPNDPKKNSNIVANLVMKDLGDGSYDSFMVEFRKKVSKLYSKFPELKNSDKVCEALVPVYNRLVANRPEEGDLTTCLADLCEMIESHHEKKAILLIDKYDNIVNRTTDDRRRTLDFLKMLYGSAFKSNPSLRFGVVTGIM